MSEFSLLIAKDGRMDKVFSLEILFIEHRRIAGITIYLVLGYLTRFLKYGELHLVFLGKLTCYQELCILIFQK